MKAHKVMILGATGMLGHTVMRHFIQRKQHEVLAVARSTQSKIYQRFANHFVATDLDLNHEAYLKHLLQKHKPHVLINALGVIKQLSEAYDPVVAIRINSLLPHQLHAWCLKNGTRLIHISTDCIFDGKKGNYKETDISNAQDLYGRSKFMGEVSGPLAVTLRTSIIGHECERHVSLVDWFLSQKNKVSGFTKALYSGFPTVEMARVIHDVVLPKDDLEGLFHVSSQPISKYDLLKLIQQTYGHQVPIEPSEKLIIDRTLDSTKFQQATGYKPPAWSQLVQSMYQDYSEFKQVCN